MRKATKKDKNLVIDIISDTFDSNPAVNWTVKQDNKVQIRYRRLANFVFKKSIRRKSIYLSTDEQAVMVFYENLFMKESFRDILDKMVMAIGVIGIFRIGEITKREKHIELHRINEGSYIYCWFFGAKKTGRGGDGPVELKDLIISESERTKLPIIMETTIAVIMRVYQRYGFTVYHEWKVNSKGLTYWLMKREVI